MTKSIEESVPLRHFVSSDVGCGGGAVVVGDFSLATVTVPSGLYGGGRSDGRDS